VKPTRGSGPVTPGRSASSGPFFGSFSAFERSPVTSRRAASVFYDPSEKKKKKKKARAARGALIARKRARARNRKVEKVRSQLLKAGAKKKKKKKKSGTAVFFSSFSRPQKNFPGGRPAVIVTIYDGHQKKPKNVPAAAKKISPPLRARISQSRNHPSKLEGGGPKEQKCFGRHGSRSQTR